MLKTIYIIMKCEGCPYLALEGIENDLKWCKLYNAAAPIEGCEGERDAYLKQQEATSGFLDNSPGA
jgi:hypothetical protein